MTLPQIVSSINFIILMYFCYNICSSESDLPRMLPVSDDKRIFFATVGQPYTLRCPVITRQYPHITFIEWSKGTIDFYNKYSEGFTLKEKGALRIRNVSLANAGIYTCNATNGHGSISIKIQLIVNEAPITNTSRIMMASEPVQSNSMASSQWIPNIEESTSKNIKEETGGAVVLLCKASGYPAPHIFWMKNGNLVDSSEYDQTKSRSRTQSSLVLHKIQRSDSGVYRCVAKNNVGKDQMDFTLQVVDPLYPPEILSLKPPNTTVMAGHMVVFKCKGKSLAFLKLHIKWMKTIDTSQVSLSNRTFKLGTNYYKVLDTDEDPIMASNGRFQSELLISNATIEDSGTYVCLAVNDNGYKYKNVSLKVFTPMKTMPSHPTSPPSPSFVIFLVFSTAVVMAPIAFFWLLYCKCDFVQKLKMTEISAEIENLRSPKDQHCSEYIAEKCKNSLTTLCSSEKTHQTSNLLSSQDTEIYNLTISCTSPSEK